MALYYLDDGLKEATEIASREERWDLLDSQRKAAKLMKETISGDVNLAAVQGPPGTGKTSVVEAFAKEQISDFVTSSENELILYIAPTNHLVFEAFRRITAQLIRAGYDIQSILKILRVYGSKIKLRERGQISIGDTAIDGSELNRLMGPIDNDVRIVFATEFQRISSRLGEFIPEKTHIVADEASKSPYFRVFLPLAERIARNPDDFYPYSLLVLGDPQQAITVPEEFKEMNVPLLMKLVDRILTANDMKDDCWIMLDTTFRLPRPSEDPISYGFYNGKLTAQYSARQRMSLIIDSVLDNFDNILRSLDRAGFNIKSYHLQTVVNAIEEAVSSASPIIVINTHPFRRGDTFDAERVKLTFLTSAIFQMASRFSNYDFSVTTTAPYCDIVDSVSFKFRKIRGLRKPRAVTVQSIIGGESDVIIAALGKEWESVEVHYYPTDEMATIYKREPELLNVQLSRHRSVLVIVGNIEKLARLRDRRIQKATQKLAEMDGRGAVFSRINS
ncbi:hypothetical protein DRP04_08890 [Archaeoglobales archaeon]|nr:MAG: hypothetical protein DRP04_08890 [Archaeoglobales archaeon]